MTYFGKIQIKGQTANDDFVAITDAETGGLLFYEEIQKPHANLFVQRWNSQPDLLEACKAALLVILQSKDVAYQDEIIDDLNKAIAKAKE